MKYKHFKQALLFKVDSDFYKKGEKFCIIQIFFLPLRQQRPA